MNEKSRIIRAKKEPGDYYQLHRESTENTDLSWKAKGMHGHLMSKPDNWETVVADLQKRSTDGRDAVRSGILELEKAGYMVREVVREKGKIVSHNWYVHERAIPEKDRTSATNGKTVSGLSSSGKSDASNNDLSNNDLRVVYRDYPSNPFATWQNKLGGINKGQADALSMLLDDWEEHTLGLDEKHPDREVSPNEAVSEAVVIMSDAGAYSVNYPRKIIENWINRGFQAFPAGFKKPTPTQAPDPDDYTADLEKRKRERREGMKS